MQGASGYRGQSKVFCEKHKETLVWSNLCGLSRAGLSNEHKALMPVEDVIETFLVLPDGQLQPLLEDLVKARRVRQVGEGVDLLIHGRLLQREHPDAGHGGAEGHGGHLAVSIPVSIAVSVTVSIPFLRPVVTISVTVLTDGRTQIITQGFVKPPVWL